MSSADNTVRIGQVVGTHGVKGGLKVRPLTDFPERFEPGRVVTLAGAARKIVRTGWHKGQARIQVEGVTSMTQAETLRGEFVTVSTDEKPPLSQGEHLESDILGFDVVTPNGTSIGTLDSIVHGPAQDVLVVGNAMIPCVEEFVQEIDEATRRIVVTPIPGMLDETEAETVEQTPRSQS